MAALKLEPEVKVVVPLFRSDDGDGMHGIASRNPVRSAPYCASRPESGRLIAPMRAQFNNPATTGLVLLATVGIVWFMAPGPSAVRDRGAILPHARLEPAGGAPRSLYRWLGGEPALVLVAPAADSATLAGFARELRMARQRLPHLRTLVVVVDSAARIVFIDGPRPGQGDYPIGRLFRDLGSALDGPGAGGGP
jgi:hypothetical protein